MTLTEAADYLRQYELCLITSHDGPDADGLGASYALALALESIGKTAQVLLGSLPSAKYRFIDKRNLFQLFDPNASAASMEEACLIILDTHDISYLGGNIDALVGKTRGLLVLDHHEPKGEIPETACIQPTASSTCELVYGLARELGATLPEDAAEAIFAGIVYDTGSFAYPKTSAETFATAHELVKLGVKPYLIHNRMYESASIGVLLLQKLVYASLELLLDNRVGLQVLTRQDLAASGAAYEDGEDLVNVPLRGRTVEVSLLFKENLDGKLRCSLRSKGKVNVAHIAQLFGGGGHRTAAGFTCDRPLEAMKVAVLENIARALDQ